MRRFLGEVGIVEVEISDERAVGERGEVGKGLMTGSPQGCAVRHLDGSSELTRDATGWRVPGAERAAEAVEDSPFDFVHHGTGQIIVTERLAVPSQTICEHA